jgi:hypothetical protein
MNCHLYTAWRTKTVANHLHSWYCHRWVAQTHAATLAADLCWAPVRAFLRQLGHRFLGERPCRYPILQKQHFRLRGLVTDVADDLYIMALRILRRFLPPARARAQSDSVLQNSSRCSHSVQRRAPVNRHDDSFFGECGGLPCSDSYSRNSFLDRHKQQRGGDTIR